MKKMKKLTCNFKNEGEEIELTFLKGKRRGECKSEQEGTGKRKWRGKKSVIQDTT